MAVCLHMTAVPYVCLHVSQLIENLAKHMIMLKDSSFTEMMAFLDEAEKYGKDIPTNFASNGKNEARTVAWEARALKRMFLRLRD